MKYFISTLIFMCLISCVASNINSPCGNLREVRRISRDFPREYTGLDTLIRIDGFFYGVGSARGNAFMLSSNSEFFTFGVRFENHTRIQEAFRGNIRHLRMRTGSYVLSGDTIKVRWALPFNPRCYSIFSEYFVILNDTTLKQIRRFCENCSEYQNPVRNDIFRFFQFDIYAE